jgi:hypothetical protein
MMVAREQNLMGGLVRNFSGQGMFVRRSSIYGTVTFAEVAETDDVVSQPITRTAKGALTPTEKAASYFITDQRIESDDQDIVADASRELGMGLADAVESSIIASFDDPDDLLSQVVDNFWVDTVYGVRFFVSSNIPVDSNADAYGALFARDAIALDVRRAPRVERARDISRRGLEVVMSSIWATGVWRPEYGVTLFGDATAPTY